MYLKGLGADICSTPAGARFQYCQEQAARQSLQQGSRNAGRMQSSECMAAGGVPVNCSRPSPGMPGFGKQYCDCLIAAPTSGQSQAAPANVTVTVSPQIQTEVSPQISPVFQQQYQPTNSPATAGTAQTSAPPAPPAGPIGVNSTSMQPIAPAQLPQAPAPSYTAPSYAAAPVSYTPPAQADQLPPSPLPTATPPPAAPQVSTATAAPAFDWKIAAIIGAGLFGAMAFSKRK